MQSDKSTEQAIEDLQQQAIRRDIHIEKLIACGTNAEIKQEITRFKEEKANLNDKPETEKTAEKTAEKTVEKSETAETAETANKYNAAKDIKINEIILALIIYFVFSVAFSQSITAWAAATLGVSVALATILLTASVIMIFKVGVNKSFLVTELRSKYKGFMDLNSTQKIEYSLYAAAYLLFLFVPFMPIGGAFFSTILAYASILFEIGVAPTAIILMIVWALVPMTIINGVAANKKGDEKATISKELLHKNPVHRIRQVYFHMFHELYLHGMQNPISMLMFSIVFFGTLTDMCYPFLPTFIHNILIIGAQGVTNAALGPFVSGFMLGWFLGLFTLVVCDIIGREQSNTSNTLLACAKLRDNLLDAILFTIVLTIGAHLMAGSAISYMCGHWEIIGLLIINIKPILGIYDFVTDPVKSVIGTCTILVPLMPFIIVMYPELCIEYLLDFIITSITNTISYASSILIVLLTALLDLAIIANQKLNHYIPRIPNNTANLADIKDNLFYSFERNKTEIATAYKRSEFIAEIAKITGKILNIAYISMSLLVTACATSLIIPNIVIPILGTSSIGISSIGMLSIIVSPATLLSWGMWPVTILSGFFGSQAAPLIAAMAGAYILTLSLCNIFISLENRKTVLYLKDNLFIALLFFTICPLLAVHTQAMIIMTYSTFTAQNFSLLAIMCSLVPCYILNNIKQYSTKGNPIIADIYQGIANKSQAFAVSIDENTKPCQTYAYQKYDAASSYIKETANSWLGA
mgnify:CR=1 FL=1|tara:strand:+ start:473 stop:2731 length:2259 start_codon:yes stop_codon:yes gene_type:complete